MNSEKHIMYFKEFRDKMGLTQKDICERLGISQATLSRYEGNSLTPKHDNIVAYIEKLNANPIFLYTGKGPHLLDSSEVLEANLAAFIADMRIFMSVDEIESELKNVLLHKLIKKLTTQSDELIKYEKLFFKFFKLLRINRPMLFLYYIMQIIRRDYKPNADAKGLLLGSIKNYNVLNLIKNDPLFTSSLKEDFIITIEEKFSQAECDIIVKNHQIIIEILEETMPPRVLKTHKNKFKE